MAGTFEAGTFGAAWELSRTIPIGLRLNASALRDYELANELFSRLLFPTDTNELLSVPWKEVRKAAVGCIIWVS